MTVDKTIKISAVSYTNTFPFIYGLKQKMDASNLNLSIDIPSQCAEKLISGEVDIGLIPIAKLKDVPNGHIISQYCIGAVKQVKTVLLMSRVPLNEIQVVYLDSESRTSVNLVKVLAKHYWNKKWQWKDAPINFPEAEEHESIVLIGDKTYNYLDDYPYRYDLAEVWYEFTQKPFVFAAWVANRELDLQFISQFNQALSFGLQNISAALDVFADECQKAELSDYLNNYISYELDQEKRAGMELFLQYLADLD